MADFVGLKETPTYFIGSGGNSGSWSMGKAWPARRYTAIFPFSMVTLASQ